MYKEDKEGPPTMIETTLYFSEAIDFSGHPLSNAKSKKRVQYYTALSLVSRYIADSLKNNVMDGNTNSGEKDGEQIVVLGTSISLTEFKMYLEQRLQQYSDFLCEGKENFIHDGLVDKKEVIHAVSGNVSLPWKRKTRFWLLADLALILLDDGLIAKASSLIKECLGNGAKTSIDDFLNVLLDNQNGAELFPFADNLIKQYHENLLFSKKSVKKLVVTANMSAGKSTLINALVGKSVARTSQEVCTGNVCYISNKAFEDNCISLATPELSLCATQEKLNDFSWQGSIAIAAYFTGTEAINNSWCIIDTPGVNAALYKNHSKIARQVIKKQSYDRLLYVISPTNLGTDAEIRHLKWVSENVDQNKVVFILNKLDDYRSESDNISESMTALRNDLTKLGFTAPVICPISAYFGYLLKLKLTHQPFTEDEQDEYDLLSKKFSKQQFDLSVYYDNSNENDSDTTEIKLCKKSGLYGLEKIIYGGTV